MGKILSFLIVVVILVLGLVAVGHWCAGPENGIVSLEDWGQGIALCGEEGPTGTQVHDDFTAINRAGIYLLINDGHQGDPEVQELFKLALKECVRY